MYKSPFLKIVSTTLVEDMYELFCLEGGYTKAGYKGIILRSLKSLYKQGRPTVRQGWLLKFSRFDDETHNL
jgi:hypothetical protein